MFDLPQPHTLSGQTTIAIRKAIVDGTWQGFLPSERRLCGIFQVSRPTIRSALQSLAKQGFIRARARQRYELLDRPKRTSPGNRLVAFISHERPSLGVLRSSTTGQMREQLSRHEFSSLEFVISGRTGSAQCRKVDSFLRQNRVHSCVLISASREVQTWFTARSIPVLVLGSCHADVQLPSLDVDYRAVCRHAAGVFRRQGHRRIAFIVPETGYAGDLASEKGFIEGTAGVEGTIIRHRGTATHLAARVAAVFATSRPPTALLVAKPAHILSVLVQLLRLGIKIPDTVSLIARDHDPLFEHELAHYAFGDESFVRRFSRLMLQLVGQSQLPTEPSLIIPRYVAGQTVRAPALV